MANLQPPLATERNANILLDEEDERERVLLVVVGGSPIKGSEVLIGAPATKGSEVLIGTDSAPTRYAMSVALVREVIRNRATTRVPGTPASMRGLVNVRGMVVTVLDLAMCLGLTSTERVPVAAPVNEAPADSAGAVTGPRAQMPGSIVLLEHGGRLVGLAVDSVLDVRPLDDVGLVTDAADKRSDFVQGLASAGGEVVMLLDVAALLSRHLISSAET